MINKTSTRPNPRSSRCLSFALMMALLMFPVLAAADDPRRPGDPLERHLFPPELIMQHQSEIDLREDQRQGIVQEVQQMQTDVVPLQFELSAAMEGLASLVAEPVVDEAAALAQAERIMELEGGVKTRHLTLLVRLKNLLTPEQQQRLQSLRHRG